MLAKGRTFLAREREKVSHLGQNPIYSLQVCISMCMVSPLITIVGIYVGLGTGGLNQEIVHWPHQPSLDSILTASATSIILDCIGMLVSLCLVWGWLRSSDTEQGRGGKKLEVVLGTCGDDETILFLFFFTRTLMGFRIEM